MDHSFVRGIAWTGGIKWLSQLLSWASTLIVARILSPDDYGLLGMATVYLGFVTLINEFGLGAAIITQRELTKDQIAQINSFCVLIGLGGFLVSCILASPLSVFFKAPDLGWVVIVMSTAFVVSALRTVPSSLLERELQFRLLALADGVQAFVQALSTVAFAVIGLRYWALVLGGLLGATLSTALVLAWRSHSFSWPRPRSVRDALTFSWHLLVMRICWFVSTKTDYLVAGRVLGQAALGAYAIGWTLAQVPVDKITSLVARVAFPLFAIVKNDPPAMRRYLLSLTEGLGLLTFPLAFGLGLVADDFVLIVLGEKWKDAIGPLRLLAFLTALRAIYPLVPQILTVVGEARFVMYVGLVTTAVAPIGFYVGSQWGIVGIAIAWCVIQPLNVIPVYWRLFDKIGLTPGHYVKSLGPAFSGSLCMTLAVLLVNYEFRNDLPVLWLFVAEVMAGAMAYIAAVMVLHRERVTNFLQLLKSTRRETAV